MATQPTQNAVPSESPRDLKFNAGKIDEFVTSLAQQYIDRFGNAHYTIEGLKQLTLQQIYNLGWSLKGTFQGGGTVTAAGDLLQDTTTFIWYRWDNISTLPKTVPSGSTPASAGGTGPGKWQPVDVADVLRKDLASSSPGKGASLVALESGDSVQKTINSILAIPQRCTHAANLLADGTAIIVECYGDSTMWGSIPGATTTQDPKNSVAELQTTLNLLFPGLCTTRNKAIPGTTLKKLLAGTDGGVGTFDERMAASDALVIYCNHCLNDCNSYQSDEREYKDNLYKFVNTVRKYNKIPVIVTPTIISPTDDGKEYQQKRMPAFIQAQRDVATEMKVDLVDNFYYSYKTSRYYKVTDIAGDGVHLTQTAYQAAGRNMCIPILEPHCLKYPNDLSGLATSPWRDTITNARNIFKVNSRFGSVLSGDAIATSQNIYYPIILDNPTDNTTIAFGGLQGTAGGYASFTYSGATGDVRFSGIIDFKRSASEDYDALFIPARCALGAGLHVLGIISNTSANGANFTFGGVTIIPRREVSNGFSDGTGRLSARLISMGDEITFSSYIAVDSPAQELFSLKGNLSTDTINSLTIKNALGNISLVAGGVTTTIGTITQSGMQDCRINLNDNRTITVRVGGFNVTSAVMPAAIPTSYVNSRGTYMVRKP